jgi:hypothetical protein
MQTSYYNCGDQAVNTEEIPPSALEPLAEPLQCKKPSQKRENRSDQAWKSG